MNEKFQPVANALKDRFNLSISEFRDEVTVVVPPAKIVEICRVLRDEFSFNMLVNETAVDYWPQTEPRFHVIYHLRAIPDRLILCLRVPLDGNAPSLPTIDRNSWNLLLGFLEAKYRSYINCECSFRPRVTLRSILSFSISK